MEDLSTLFTAIPTSLTIGGFTLLVGHLWLKKKLTDVEDIPALRARIIGLESQAVQHNETKEAVIRMEEQIKHLTEQVRVLSELLMRKVFK